MAKNDYLTTRKDILDWHKRVLKQMEERFRDGRDEEVSDFIFGMKEFVKALEETIDE